MAIQSEHVGRLLQQRSMLAPFIALATILAVGTLGLWPTLTALGRIWIQMLDYHHGFLVVGVTLGWLFMRRELIDASALRTQWHALVPLAVAVLAWIVAFRANSELMQQLLVPILLQLAVLASLGRRIARLTLAPLAYLYFAIPVWEHLLPLLQWLTTQVTEFVLRLMGVATQVDGHSVTIPEGKFDIVEGCSGKRYLVIGLAFATMAGVTYDVRGRNRVTLIAIAMLAALVTNWLRVATVIYVGHVSNMQHYLVAREHLSFGYALFIPLMALIMLVARRLSHRGETRSAHGAEGESTLRPSAIVWGATAVLLLTPLLAASIRQTLAAPVALLPLPVMTGTWQGPLPASSRWQPQFVGAAGERRAAYSSANGRVEVYYNVYGPQSAGHELVHFNNVVVPTEWTVISRSPLPGSGSMLITADDPDGARWVVAQELRVGGLRARSPALAQVVYGVQAMWRAVPSGAVVLAAVCEPDCEQARANLLEFRRENGDRLAQLIPRRFEGPT
jgi:EpsI family protein